MSPGRWKVVNDLLKREPPSDPVVLAIAPPPIQVVLCEVPVLIRDQPPLNPLRGFVQEAVSILGTPTAAEVSRILCLPPGMTDLVLGNLRQLDGLARDAAGRWSMPAGAPQFRGGRDHPFMLRRTRRLLCYWPSRGRVLPLLPRMRLRDLVRLEIHRHRDDVEDGYRAMLSLAGMAPGVSGLEEGILLLPLAEAPATATRPTAGANAADAPIEPDEILVCRCRLDVIGLTWAVRREGAWEIRSRLWSRPTPAEGEIGESFAAAGPWAGLSLPEQLLGDAGGLDRLSKLFDREPQGWRELLKERRGDARVRRDLDGPGQTILVVDAAPRNPNNPWHGLHTTLSPDARLLARHIGS